MDSYSELREAVERVELVDAHAHNIISSSSSTFPFLRCFSEAEGDALTYAPHTLSFKRSVRDIGELYGCDACLDGIETHRTSLGLDSITSKCFQASNISALLVDDGLHLPNMLPLSWHTKFVPFVGRIIRIESLAENILNNGVPNGSNWTLNIFTEIFVNELKSIATEAVALKSIAAYRGGLEIDPFVNKKDAEEGLFDILKLGKPTRIQNKRLIDYIFICSLEVALLFDLPIQLHTGFGDKDLDLRTSNPLHLRDLLEDKRYHKCRIVLLHASYPFSREASYLASVYPQVYLDFGLAVPKLSVHGMISSVKELLDLAPIKKVMFSTDGYAFPETFYLGAKRARKVVYSVLRGACIDGDLTIPEAKEAAEDIFKNNSLRFYKIADRYSFAKDTIIPYDLWKTENEALHDGITFVRMIWVDTSGQHRCRVIPTKRFYNVVKKNGVGLTVASMALISGIDAPAEGTNLTGVGEIRLVPDMLTKWRIPWAQREEMVLADMQVRPGEAWEYCPREALRRVSKVLKDEFNLEMDVGFENEFYLLKNVLRDGKEDWLPFDSTPYCSTSAFDYATSFFQEVNLALQSMKISVEQFHAEAGQGQFEVALGHTVCNLAADNLIFTREVIKAIARKNGMLATFLPKPRMDDVGSGSHAHVSLLENGKNIFMASNELSRYGMSKVGEEFMAGVFSHLPSILAFIAPVPNSYDRIQPNTWSGAYHCWGKENREAPLRTVCPPGLLHGCVSNFEIKSFDGCANPHLGLASIIAAGVDGLRRHLSLPDPIDTNPYEAEGAIPRLPLELLESVEALEKDGIFKDLIGEKLVTAVIGVRKAEVEFYSKNKNGFRKLIHRY